MGAVPQALEIIFEVQRKKINENITRKKKSFPTLKKLFFNFFNLPFGPLLLSNLITFLFLIHFKQLKILHEHHLNYYK
jgi:hypothetical protein